MDIWPLRYLASRLAVVLLKVFPESLIYAWMPQTALYNPPRQNVLQLPLGLNAGPPTYFSFPEQAGSDEGGSWQHLVV